MVEVIGRRWARRLGDRLSETIIQLCSSSSSLINDVLLYIYEELLLVADESKLFAVYSFTFLNRLVDCVLRFLVELVEVGLIRHRVLLAVLIILDVEFGLFYQLTQLSLLFLLFKKLQVIVL